MKRLQTIEGKNKEQLKSTKIEGWEHKRSHWFVEEPLSPEAITSGNNVMYYFSDYKTFKYYRNMSNFITEICQKIRLKEDKMNLM